MEHIHELGLLVFTVLTATELVALGRDIHPETALPAYRAGALDLETNAVCRIGRWGQVDVGSRNVRRASIRQWQQIDGLLRGLWCRHG